jgi:ABC-type transport system involved in multi-copper enzyme maturation permease subunit
MLPTFALEMLLAERRGRFGVLQRRYLKWMLFLCLVAFWRLVEEHANQHVLWVGFFIQLCLVQHAALVFFLTPVYLAGAVAEERSQGTLAGLLTTELSPGAILLGKWLAGLVQVGSLLLTALPPLAFCAGAGLLLPEALLALMGVTLCWLCMLGAVTVYASVFSTLARRAVLRVYAMAAAVGLFLWAYRILLFPWLSKRLTWTAGLTLARWAESLLRSLEPLYVLETLWLDPDLAQFAARFGNLLLLSLTITATALLLASTSLRARSTPRPLRRRGTTSRRDETDTLGEAPILWRESLVRRPRLRNLTLGVVFFFWGVAVFYSLAGSPGAGRVWGFGLVTIFVTSLLAGMGASGSITIEREAKTWESLLTTPIDSTSLVEEKAAAASRRSYPFLFVLWLPLFCATLGSEWLQPLTIMLVGSFGVAMIRYMAATGVATSALAPGSWRSMLSTLLRGYGEILLFLTLLVVLFIFFGSGTIYFFLAMLTKLTLMDDVRLTPFAIISGVLCVTAFHFWLFHRTRRNLAAAVRHVDLERRQS